MPPFWVPLTDLGSLWVNFVILYVPSFCLYIVAGLVVSHWPQLASSRIDAHAARALHFAGARTWYLSVLTLRSHLGPILAHFPICFLLALRVLLVPLLGRAADAAVNII